MGDAASSRAPGDSSHATREESSTAQNPQHAPETTSAAQAHYPYMTAYTQPSTLPIRQDAFHMASLGGTLPSYPDYNQSSGPRYSSSPAGISFQSQNPQQFIQPQLQTGTAVQYTNQINPGYHGQFLPTHAPSPQSLQGGTMNSPHFYGNHSFGGQTQQQGQGYYMQPNQFVPQSPVYPVVSGLSFGARPNFSDYRQNQQQRGKDFVTQAPGLGPQGRSGSIASSSGQSSVVRGPPRKPRQSGHAIWIGNLPPQTDLMSLVLHVCKETNGLESLFLISKSNCAFANFKDEASCAEAQAKIHDSRFQTVRLVSRLRRNSVSTTGETPVPTGPADSTRPPVSSTSQTPPAIDGEFESIEQQTNLENKVVTEDDDSTPPKDKFFIVKSLTVEDLELSVRNGIWATQSHNEEALNKAYQTAENVYLVFSANKSGEYFGYAKMISPINNDPAAAIEFAPKAQPAEDPAGELPKAIPTPASEFAPKGRIIDDSARGTIFWEVERDESEDEEEEETTRSEADGTPATKAWGKPFKVEWISTNRLPFYRTRGLRNPWNSNREVKIARDGTELETSIGKRLLGLFHRVPSPIGPQQFPIPQMPTSYPHQMRGFQQ